MRVESNVWWRYTLQHMNSDEHMHSEDMTEDSIRVSLSLDTWLQIIRIVPYPEALWGPLTLPRSFCRLLYPKRPEEFSQQREKLQYWRKTRGEREREKCQVVPLPPVRFSRLHAPLLPRCPDNVSACMREHLFAVLNGWYAEQNASHWKSCWNPAESSLQRHRKTTVQGHPLRL